MTGHRIGYVLKVYPRFSETFVVTEILAREAQGEDIEIFALRHSTDPRFHPELARVQAPLTYVPRPFKATEAWEVVLRAQGAVPGFAKNLAALLPELSDADPTVVHQGIELATLITERGITHLHCHFANISAQVAEIASRLTGVPFSVTTHAKDLFHESVSHTRLERTLRHADHVVTISEYNRRFLDATFPGRTEHVHLVHNGLELGRFPYREPSPPGGRLHVVGVGRLVEKKGFDVLIEAAARAHGRGLPLRVSIAGGGELEQDLRNLARVRGVEDVVEFLGPRTQREIVELLREADVFAAPCVVGADGNADGLPTVLLEAMAIGVPVVATAVTGIPEVVRNGSSVTSPTGILLEPGDVAGLAEAFATVADPGWDRRGTTASARVLVETTFDSRAQAGTLRALLPPRLRVAYVSADPGIPVFGTKGASVHVQEIIRCWRTLGARVTVYTTRVGEDVPPDLADLDVVHVPVPPAVPDTDLGHDRTHRVAERERAQAEASRAIAERVVADGADAVYERYSLFSTALSTITGLLGIPGYLEVNSPLIDEQRLHRDLVDDDGARITLAQQVRAASRVACVSEPVARWVATTAAACPAPEASENGWRERILVVPNGVNVDRIRPTCDSRQDILRGSTAGEGPAEAPPVVVFVGTLKPWHGVEHLVRARSLAATDWRLRLVGDGPQRAALVELASSLGVDVDFTGAVAPDDIPDCLGDCAIAVAPYPRTEHSSDQYFSPLKVYEYCAAALPVVASAVGQIPGIVNDGVTGVLVEPSDPAALAEAIDGLVSDPTRRRSMGRAARRTAEAERSWSRVLDRILSGTELDPVTPA